MNKLRYVLLGLVLSFIGINNVFAEAFAVSVVVGDTIVPKGSEVSIKIHLDSEEYLSECQFLFESDDTIEYKSISDANNWRVNENGVNGIIISNGNLSGEAPAEGQNIAELKYKINGDGSVVIKTKQCVSTVSETSYDYEDVVIDFTTTEPVEDTTLSSLIVVNDGDTYPVNISSGNTGSYIVNLTSPIFSLEMIANDSKYQEDIVVKDVDGKVIEDVSNITFTSNQGQMPLTITVGGKTTYSLNIIYEQSDLDNSLEWISINNEKITLEKGKYDYTYTVGKDVTEVTIGAAIKDVDNFTFGERSNVPSTFPINDTVTAIIEVVPKDMSSGATSVTYYIDIVKEGTTTDDGGSTGNNSGGTGNTGTGNNVSKNPNTSDIPMLLMALILVISLIGSVVLYRKNLESYK